MREGSRSTPYIWTFLVQLLNVEGGENFASPFNVTRMTIIHEFYANAETMTSTVSMVREPDAGSINALLKIENAPLYDQVSQLDTTTDLDEVTRVRCGNVVKWIVVSCTRTAFFTKELESKMKI